METIPCLNCGKFFVLNRRNKNQKYCGKDACQRARKAAWKRQRMATDPEYKLNQILSNQKWSKSHPGYWRDYRSMHPKKAQRNRMLQLVRNRKRRRMGAESTKVDGSLIAKVDASETSHFKPLGLFYLIPMIAKVDASKVFIQAISSG